MSENEFESEKFKFLSSFNQVNISLIEDKTRDQNTNPKWYEERAKRITANNFGKICKMRGTTDFANSFKHILYSQKSLSPFGLSKSLAYGIDNERGAIEQFENICK
jgi:hypothetical protein